MKLASSASFLSTIALAAFSGAAAADDGKSELLGVDMSTNSPGQHMYDWTGFYAGVHGGYLWGDVDADYFSDLDISIDDPLFGAQAGALFQRGMFVFGAEADIALTSAGGQVCMFGCTEGFSADMEWLATLRGTAGIAFDKAYVYATGGAAIAGMDFGIIDFGSIPHFRETLTGWTAGAGASLRLSEHVSVNTQYLYFDLGDIMIDPSWGSPIDYSVTGHVARVGINIHN